MVVGLFILRCLVPEEGDRLIIFELMRTSKEDSCVSSMVGIGSLSHCLLSF